VWFTRKKKKNSVHESVAIQKYNSMWFIRYIKSKNLLSRFQRDRQIMRGGFAELLLILGRIILEVSLLFILSPFKNDVAIKITI
jgi:hypothetical protein